MDLLNNKLTVIAGPNGCGKSTLLKTISGIIKKTSGSIFIDNVDLSNISPLDRAKRIAYLSQNRSVPDIAVKNLVLHGRFPYLSYPRRYRAEDREAVDMALERMGIESIRDKMVSELSGGERQKVYIAMALAQGSDYLLLDEPTTFLDISHQFQLLDLAKELCSENKSVVMVLHNLESALSIADSFILLDKGRLLFEGSVDDVYSSKLIDKVFNVEIKKESDHWWCKKKL
ncbi:ABC transporter ATP-binding protein [Bullifex porci]|uniref:ABC transporter ATP-binding protein n=1 Tax=Bullifex porci TaxID=2606638 RepID=UPI0023F05C5B|nr:ABC transporter ATP-binding protein [Bullifex porci]MDD7256289.1 ABC transporter ATP-binding protein [Bullifex porci]MDY2740884.1 ABC transporter ATP-binding protein [Bullifex porci]